MREFGTSRVDRFLIERERPRLEQLQACLPEAVALLRLHAQITWAIPLGAARLVRCRELFPEPLRSAVADLASAERLLSQLKERACDPEMPMDGGDWCDRAISYLMEPELLKTWRCVALQVLGVLLAEVPVVRYFQTLQDGDEYILAEVRDLADRPSMLEAAPAEAARLLYQVGRMDTHRWGVDYDVRKLWNTALELVRKAEPRDRSLEARILASLSLCWQCQDEQRLPYLQRAIELADTIEVPWEEWTRWLLALGHWLEKDGDMAGALELFHRALEIADARGDAESDRALTAAACLAELYALMGDDESARPFYQRCAAGPRFQCNDLVTWLTPTGAAVSLAHAARKREDWAEAARWYEETLRLEALEGVDEERPSELLYLHLGRMRLEQNELELAEAAFDKAYELALEAGGTESALLPDILMARGELCLSVEDWPAALEQYGKALAQVEFHEYAEVYELAEIHYHLGMISLQLPPTDERESDARAHLLEAQRLFRKKENPPQAVVDQIARVLAELQD